MRCRKSAVWKEEGNCGIGSEIIIGMPCREATIMKKNYAASEITEIVPKANESGEALCVLQSSLSRFSSADEGVYEGDIDLWHYPAHHVKCAEKV